MPACAVVSCKQNSGNGNKFDGVTFHRFPKNPHLAAKWIKSAGLTRKTFTPNLRICSRHFRKNDLKLHSEKRFITETAMPSLNLPRQNQKNLPTLRNKKNVVILLPAYTGPANKGEIVRKPLKITPHSICNKKTILKPAASETMIIHENDANDEIMVDPLSEPPISPRLEIEEVLVPSYEPAPSPEQQDSNPLEPIRFLFPENLNLIQAFHSYCRAPDYEKKKLSKLKTSHEIVKRALYSERRTNERRKNTIASMKSTVSELKRKASANVDPFKFLNNTLKSGVALELTKRMVQNSAGGNLTKEQFPPELKEFAMKLQSCSGRAYDYVREVFDFALPCPSTVRAWLASAKTDSSDSAKTKSTKDESQDLDGTSDDNSGSSSWNRCLSTDRRASPSPAPSRHSGCATSPPRRDR